MKNYTNPREMAEKDEEIDRLKMLVAELVNALAILRPNVEHLEIKSAWWEQTDSLIARAKSCSQANYWHLYLWYEQRKLISELVDAVASLPYPNPDINGPLLQRAKEALKP